MYPATCLPKLLNQMMEEKNQNLINTLYRALVEAQLLYLPIDNLPEWNKGVADFFLKKALKENGNKSLQLFCIDKAIEFMFDQENLTIAVGWITGGKIVITGETLDAELTPDQKYGILKSIYSSPLFDLEKKKELRELVFKDDKSDAGVKVQEACDHSLPDPKEKERIWAEIVDMTSDVSI